MYCRAIACDFDGTGADNHGLGPELAAALGAARAHGIMVLLVTGRVLEDIQTLCRDLSLFDAVVAENGAVIHFPGSQRTIQLGQPPPGQFLGELRARGVPFHAGAVIVGMWDRHARDVLELIRRFAIDGQLIFNREAMMLLPSGINKAAGTRRALEELRRSEHNLIAFGDAENDLPVFAMAEAAVAARGAAPAIAAQADRQLSHPGSAGVAQYVHHLLQHGESIPTPSRHRIALGRSPDGTILEFPASGLNVMISGDPRSGKSWLAGLIAEQLLECGYRLCVLDPEGDYLSLAQRPRVLLLGNDVTLPEPAPVARLLRDQSVSVVLNLAALSQRAQLSYIDGILDQLGQCSAEVGLPHWILIDEAQYFFHQSSALTPRFRPTANFLFVTHRPSLLSDAVYATVGAHLIAPTTVDEERYFITSLLQARGPDNLVVNEALAVLDGQHVGALIEGPGPPQWRVFTPGTRVTAHAHHARKYADTRLPEHKAFWFLGIDGLPSPVAHNVVEFASAIETVPASSLRYHMMHGDFSRWFSEVLGDELLAHGLRKLERAVLAGAAPNRLEILAHIEDQYRITNGSNGTAE